MLLHKNPSSSLFFQFDRVNCRQQKNDKNILNLKNHFSNCSNYKNQPKREQTFRPLDRLMWSAAAALTLRDLKYRLSACSTLIYMPDVVLWDGLVGVFTSTGEYSEGCLNHKT